MPKQAILLTDAIVPPSALVRAGLEGLPAIIRGRGERASRRFIKALPLASATAHARAYARAVKQFLDGCEDRQLELYEIDSITVAAYIEQLANMLPSSSAQGHSARFSVTPSGRFPQLRYTFTNASRTRD